MLIGRCSSPDRYETQDMFITGIVLVLSTLGKVSFTALRLRPDKNNKHRNVAPALVFLIRRSEALASSCGSKDPELHYRGVKREGVGVTTHLIKYTRLKAS